MNVSSNTIHQMLFTFQILENVSAEKGGCRKEFKQGIHVVACLSCYTNN